MVGLLDSFPFYKRVIELAIASEEEGLHTPNYRGWQWHDVEVHPTRLIRLVTEGISSINMRTRQATFYVLRDRAKAKQVLKQMAPSVSAEEFEEAYIASQVKEETQRDSSHRSKIRNDRP
jgi:CRISPR/Cas system-associated exonuclease Cas4 (RecB family)